MSGAEQRKHKAAERAAEFVERGMALGLGTGSTARHVFEALAERRRRGALGDIVGVPTSRETGRTARQLGIPLTTLDEATRLDLTIDGADEVSPALDLIKGRGGALLREKIVASASERLVIVIDDSKRVGRLGEKAALPVEVVPFGWRTQLGFLRGLGADPELRCGTGGEPYVTDGGHHILDCRFERGIGDPGRLEKQMRARPGIVEVGLFIGMADVVVVGGADRVDVLRREGARA